jgi:hypothetical protein
LDAGTQNPETAFILLLAHVEYREVNTIMGLRLLFCPLDSRLLALAA